MHYVYTATPPPTVPTTASGPPLTAARPEASHQPLADDQIAAAMVFDMEELERQLSEAIQMDITTNPPDEEPKEKEIPAILDNE